MTFSVPTTILVFATLLSASAAAQTITSEKVADGLYMLSGKGGNIGLLLGSDGAFMIDDKFAPMSDAILAEVRNLGGDMPRFVINTHFHADHTGGNENLGKAGSVIVSHANVRKRLSSDTVIEAFNRKMTATAEEGLPKITFSRDIRFHLGGQTIDVVHVPRAHTDGDAFVHFPALNVIHTGDLVFNGFYPFIDVSHGGTLQGVIDAVDRMLALADDETRIIPGHGPLASRDDLVAYRHMLATAHERLSRLKAEGLSAADAAARKPLADLDDRWGNGIFTAARWIAVVYGGI